MYAFIFLARYHRQSTIMVTMLKTTNQSLKKRPLTNQLLARGDLTYRIAVTVSTKHTKISTTPLMLAMENWREV